MKAHHTPSVSIKALKISAVLILLYFIFELTVALMTKSLALLADAAHEFSTFLAIGLSIAAIEWASKRPVRTRTFGYLRIEIIAAFVNGLLLLAMAAFILVKGFNRLLNPIEVPPLPMYIVAIGGIGLEIASLAIMYRGQKESLNIRGSFWHVMNAFLGSLAIIIAATFISIAKIYVADSWAGIVFAFILIWAAYGIIKDSFNILIDATPPDVDLATLEKDLLSIPGVIGAHHFHARSLTSNIKTFSGHLIVKDLKNSERILQEAKKITDEKYKFALSTIQLENEKLAEADLKKIEYQED